VVKLWRNTSVKFVGEFWLEAKEAIYKEWRADDLPSAWTIELT
jgi:hypothetical protein